jgi:hypothetical protein
MGSEAAVAFALGVGAEDVAHGVGGVAVLADEGFERAAAAGESGQLRRGVRRRGGGTGSLRDALCFERLAQFGYLGFEALEALGDGLKGELDLAALHAELSSSARAAGLGFEALASPASRPASAASACAISLLAWRRALHGLHRGCGAGFRPVLGGEHVARGLLRLRLLRVGGFARGGGLGGGVSRKLRCCSSSPARVRVARGLREVVVAGGDALGELGDAVGVGGGAGGDALELDGGLVGAARRSRGSGRRARSRARRRRSARRPWFRARRPARRSVRRGAAISAAAAAARRPSA